MTGQPLAPYTFPPEDPYADPQNYRDAERFWWHDAVATDMARTEALGWAANTPAGIADNLAGGKPGSAWNAGDVERYLRQMLTWGEVELAPPMSTADPGKWVRLSQKEQS